MADTTTTAATNDIKPGTPPATAGEQQESATSSGDAVKPTGDAAQTVSGLPPITKEPMSVTGAPLVPSNPISQTKVPTPPPEPVTEPATAGTEEASKPPAPETDLKGKVDAADTVAKESEKPNCSSSNAESASADAASSAKEAVSEPVVNGNHKEVPKPVTVQEVQDEEMPTAPAVTTATTEKAAPEPTTEKPAETAAAAAAEPPSKPEPATTEPVPAETEKKEAEIGDKRKADESVAVNGGADSDDKTHDEPQEKKLKTNGAEPAAGPKKVGRPRKDKTAEKKAAAPVGRTARRTRSQGAAAEESL